MKQEPFGSPSFLKKVAAASPPLIAPIWACGPKKPNAKSFFRIISLPIVLKMSILVKIEVKVDHCFRQRKLTPKRSCKI